MISQTDPSYFPTMTSPIRSCGGPITNLLTIPQKQEGREGNRWKGMRMASMGHNAAFPPPPHPLYLRLPRLPCSLSGCPLGEGERRPTVGLTILYTSAGEQWRPTTKNSGNRGTAFGWLLHTGPIHTHWSAETLWCQRDGVQERAAERSQRYHALELLLDLTFLCSYAHAGKKYIPTKMSYNTLLKPYKKYMRKVNI